MHVWLLTAAGAALAAAATTGHPPARMDGTGRETGGIAIAHDAVSQSAGL